MAENRYLEFTIEQLRHRLMLSKFVLAVLDKSKDDPRYGDAHMHYLSEQELISQALGAREIEPVVVGLKSVSLSGKLRPGNK